MVGISFRFHFEKHNDEVLNNQGNVVQYDGNLYFINSYVKEGKPHYELSFLPVEFIDENQKMTQTPKGLVNFESVLPGKNLMIDSDKIFYYFSGSTYYYDIIEKNIHKFCDGALQYLNSSRLFYLTLYDGKIFQGIFYAGTWNTREINQLTSSRIVKLEEDTDYIYYYVPLEKSVLMGLRKSDLVAVIFDTIDSSEYSLMKIKLAEKEIIELLKKDEEYYTTSIHKKTKAKGEINAISQEEANALLKSFMDQYTVRLEDKVVNLYENGKQITSISYSLEEVESVSLEKVELVGNYLYYELLLKSVTQDNGYKKTESILARCNHSGGISYQMNIK